MFRRYSILSAAIALALPAAAMAAGPSARSQLHHPHDAATLIVQLAPETTGNNACYLYEPGLDLCVTTMRDAMRYFVLYKKNLAHVPRNGEQEELPDPEVLMPPRSRPGRTAVGATILVRVNPSSTIEQAIAELEADPKVLSVSPNFLVKHTATANDPQYTSGALWGMYSGSTTPANVYGSGAALAWVDAAGGNCSNVVVGIIDEGYMYNHADLAANAFKNPGEVAGNGLDDDGNGYVDDVYGWDFDGNNAQVFDGVGDDHGTHVAGTIGAVGGNATGVAGVCWQVKLLNAKFLGSRGGTTANAIKAVNYFTDLKLRHGLNLVATNNSWGGGGYSQALEDAISEANDAGILFIAAAGNSGANNDATPSYPSGYNVPNVIAVAAIDKNGALASYSQYGNTSVDIAAPGSAIVSTVPVASGKGKNATVASGYASYSGTSMATPHVTGAAALYAARHPGSTAAQIKAAILGSAIYTPSVNGKVATDGRLDVSGY